MHDDAVRAGGWLINGFQTMSLLAVWGAAVLGYGFFWRSMNRSEPDPIRPSGPFGD